MRLLPFVSCASDDIHRDLQRGNGAPVLKQVQRASVLGPADSRTVVRGYTVAMIRDHTLEDENDARSVLVIVDGAENTAGIYRDLAHAKLSSFHALDLWSQVDGCKQLHHDPCVSSAVSVWLMRRSSHAHMRH